MDEEKKETDAEDKKNDEYGSLDHMRTRTQTRLKEAMERKNPLPREREEQKK